MSLKVMDIAFQNIAALDPAKLVSSQASPNTLVVGEQTPALSVVSVAAHSNTRLIVVTDTEDKPIGVVVPAWVLRQLKRMKSPNAKSLLEAVKELKNDPQEAARGFHHEWLNLDRPEIYWCQGGQHYVDTCPCSVKEHQGSPCRPE